MANKKLPEAKRWEIFKYYLQTGATYKELKEKFNPDVKGTMMIELIIGEYLTKRKNG